MDGVEEVYNLDEHVVMAFDVGMWCALCAWFDLDVLLDCNNLVQCFLFGVFYPLSLLLHVPLLCFVRVGKVLVD
jgi:hypothetical protein